MFPASVKRVLVPIDLSAVSLAAWRKARELADRLGATLDVVHVMGLPEAALDGFAGMRTTADVKRRVLKRLRDHVGAQTPVHLAWGEPENVILRLIRHRKYDLVVMGTHGRSGLNRLVLGSVAEGVIGQSPVPVLAVRGKSKPVESLLVPVAFTHYALTGFAVGATLAAKLGCRMTVLHVVDDPTKEADPRAFIQSLIQRLPPSIRDICNPKVEVVRQNPADAIVRAAKNHDLTVLVYHRKEGLKNWWDGTTLQQILRRTGSPVLSVPYLKPESPRRRSILRDAFPGPAAALKNP